MPRRRNNDADTIELIVKLGGLLLLLGFISFGVRNVEAAIVLFLGLVIGVLVLVCAGFLIIKFVQNRRKRTQQPEQIYSQHFDSATSTSPSVATHLDILSTAHDTAQSPPPNLIDQLRKIDWFQFEKLVALIYESQGFEVTRRGGANPDGGIDLIIEKDGVKQAVQCKQWKMWNVGVKTVREFLGALTDSQIQRGIFITLNGYTGDAKKLAEKHGIEIINETGLRRMLEGVKIQDRRILEILNDTNKYCPKCERLMVVRVAGKGQNRGEQFWGCSGYPRCKFTMQMTG